MYRIFALSCPKAHASTSSMQRTNSNNNNYAAFTFHVRPFTVRQRQLERGLQFVLACSANNRILLIICEQLCQSSCIVLCQWSFSEIFQQVLPFLHYSILLSCFSIARKQLKKEKHFFFMHILLEFFKKIPRFDEWESFLMVCRF